MTHILQKENPVLHTKASEVNDISSPEIKKHIDTMADALFAEPDGIGIAAPQIGILLRMFLVTADVLDPKILEQRMQNTKKIKPSQKDYFVFINPVFQKLSKQKTKDTEGCLSVRGYFGTVVRSEKATITYYDHVGKKISRGVSGLFARVLQHEMDHLNGMLFVNKATDIRHITTPSDVK